jgi:hypothetical protein
VAGRGQLLQRGHNLHDMNKHAERLVHSGLPGQDRQTARQVIDMKPAA